MLHVCCIAGTVFHSSLPKLPYNLKGYKGPWLSTFTNNTDNISFKTNSNLLEVYINLHLLFRYPFWLPPFHKHYAPIFLIQAYIIDFHTQLLHICFGHSPITPCSLSVPKQFLLIPLFPVRAFGGAYIILETLKLATQRQTWKSGAIEKLTDSECSRGKREQNFSPIQYTQP